MDLLKQALIDISHADAENAKVAQVNIEDQTEEQSSSLPTQPPLVPNDALAAEGAALLSNALTQYLRATFPHLPEEGVDAFVAHLTSTDVVADVAFHIGLKDLIKCQVSLQNYL
jgi:dsRNA-specific ribonuclease